MHSSMGFCSIFLSEEEILYKSFWLLCEPGFFFWWMLYFLFAIWGKSWEWSFMYFGLRFLFVWKVLMIFISAFWYRTYSCRMCMPTSRIYGLCDLHFTCMLYGLWDFTYNPRSLKLGSCVLILHCAGHVLCLQLTYWHVHSAYEFIPKT